jgi:hypothetical protein
MRIAHITCGSRVNPPFRQLFRINMKFPPDRINLMKSTIFVLCFLCATAAFAQNAPVQSGVVQPIQMIDHPQHASEHAMATESTLLSTSPYGYAKGEVPLVELGSLKYETPLGDVARAYRKEHAAVPKAAKVAENW